MVNKVPPRRVIGSARFAMRMKVEQGHVQRLQKPSRSTSTTRPCRASLGEKAPLYQLCGHKLADPNAGGGRVVGDDGEVALVLAHDFIDQPCRATA
jgi:hypothetical protein